MSSLFYRKSRNSSFTAAPRHTSNPQHAFLSNLVIYSLKHTTPYIQQSSAHVLGPLHGIYLSKLFLQWLGNEDKKPLPLTKLVGSTCWSRVCNVCTASWKKDVLYLKYFLGRSIGTELTAFLVKTVFPFFSQKVIE